MNTYKWRNHSLNDSKGYRIYYNLHKQCWSVQGYVNGRGWRVIGHTDSVVATHGIKFEVNQAGRDRVVKERRKNVHAYAYCGNLVQGLTPVARYTIPVCYSPYDNDVIGAEGRGAFQVDGPGYAIGAASRGWFAPDGYVYLQPLRNRPR